MHTDLGGDSTRFCVAAKFCPGSGGDATTAARHATGSISVTVFRAASSAHQSLRSTLPAAGRSRGCSVGSRDHSVPIGIQPPEQPASACGGGCCTSVGVSRCPPAVFRVCPGRRGATGPASKSPAGSASLAGCFASSWGLTGSAVVTAGYAVRASNPWNYALWASNKCTS